MFHRCKFHCGQSIDWLIDLFFLNCGILFSVFFQAGPGPRSEPVTVTTQEDIPGPVQSLHIFNIRDRTLELSWMDPDYPNGENITVVDQRSENFIFQIKNILLMPFILIFFLPSYFLGVLTGFTVECGKVDEAANQTAPSRKFPLRPELHGFTVDGLEPQTNYVVKVYASTKLGDGDATVTRIRSSVPPSTTALTFLSISIFRKKKFSKKNFFSKFFLKKKFSLKKFSLKNFFFKKRFSVEKYSK